MTNQPQSPQAMPAGRQEIKIVDSIPGAEYANAMQANHNKDEFQLSFFTLAGGSGRVVSKVITSPGHFKRMVSALAENLKKYEEQFGEIKEAAGSEKEIGFKS